ncbi:BrxA/BrxB family bacilliredoxin [Bernardetia sp.]|uniref:BrxA/BrxB family bacilliredoxin n=1 Tax=Bernardetia sp. TaxID=1937974 RepID=UPI0025BC7438|nr:BrxA/BrxB family bacilliredoxin [Bernardetia sp.]
MYPEHLTTPMKGELVNIGFKDVTTPEQVETVLSEAGTTLMVINSVCGCAAGAARPGVRMALEKTNKKPTQLATVFAGVDKEAVEKVRELAMPYPPSSPSIALFKNGEVIHFVERHHIEGRSAEAISEHLKAVFEELC